MGDGVLLCKQNVGQKIFSSSIISANLNETLYDPLSPLTLDFLQNPYPMFDRLRAEAPVFWSNKGRYWLISRYADAHTLLRELPAEMALQRRPRVNPRIQLIPPAAELLKSRSHWLLAIDPPDHTRLRSIFNKAFTPAMVNQLRPRIQKIASDLIDALQDKAEIELISDYAFVLPVTVITEMLGIPAEDRDKFRHWSHALTQTLEPRPVLDLDRINRANQSNRDLIDYLRPLIQDRRRNPKNDLISALVEAEEKGNKLSEQELLGNCVLLLVGGHETTVNLIGNGVLALLRNPEQLEMLKSDPTLIVSAVEEFLRYDSPAQIVRGVAVEEIELRGCRIKKGDMIVILLGACNRDPAVFPKPDKLDIQRSPNKHISFSEGIHYCLGASLARAEGKIAIATLINRLPGFRLKTDKVEYKQPFALRGVKELLLSCSGGL